MKIVHAPTEIAGQMGMLCEGLRSKGHEVNGYNWFMNYLKYTEHIVSTDAYELMKLVDQVTDYSDVIHFHNGNTFLSNNNDLPYIANKNKKMVMHHWGNDVRTVKMVSETNPYSLPPSYLTDEEIHKSLTHFSSYIDTAIVQDHEMLPYVKEYYKNVHVLPLACNTKRFEARFPSPDNKIPKIIHAPTNREFKGSTFVDAAITTLKKESNLQFDYQKIEKLSHAQALKMYLEADIIIDQLLCGTYGMLSVEAMAMGKVVVAYIRDDVRLAIPEYLPIVSATPSTLDEVLRILIKDPVSRYNIGVASRRFVEAYHDTSIVVDKLCSIYAR
ncbi:glycosyltransferase [Anaerobacillus isosaccharinicus]|uniref:Glycosyltransferase n=1 Tax=Anaerobacillus isosaccharinicus TaxID=1532552 RepID=A0A1S2M842_9BACI|nr:glycosyltransferase [Anaerobacillus isosaccharinicus]MBA5587615.1 glycosyltransferase [Anaerobacillus isosaccharinicus]QOY34208.1 glycosyltransferase [Anaerobacillus isosaccharinicus]